MKKTFVWVSRHDLTAEQRLALEDMGFSTIVEAGDIDAFDCDALKFSVHFSATGEFDLSEREVGNGRIAPMVTVGVVHPAAALTLKSAGYPVAVSRNVNRAPEGERPQFEFDGWVFF